MKIPPLADIRRIMGWGQPPSPKRKADKNEPAKSFDEVMQEIGTIVQEDKQEDHNQS